MKKIYFMLLVSIMFLTFANIATAQVNVTIRVDMQEQTVSPDGVHVAGSFQGWDPAGTPMTLLFDNIYEHTFQANPDDHVLYKYVNGDSWVTPQPEIVPLQCGEDDGGGNINRVIDVPDHDTVLTVVCFGSCVPCNVPEVNVTLQVDMSDETVSAVGVHVAGSFNNWDPSATILNHVGGNVYAVTVPMGIGEYHEFKYLNGNMWGTQESVPQACGVDDGNGAYNRYLEEVPASDTILPAVCFGSCVPCDVPEVDVTFQVDMSNETVSENGVHVAGAFNAWDTDSTEMTHIGDDVYAVTLQLGTGESHQYKFLNGITWDDEEIVPTECAVGTNRNLLIPIQDTVLLDVCFGSCDTCSNTVDVYVTFKVDMSLADSISTAGIHIAGGFQGWNPAATEMTDVGDGIFEYLTILQSGSYYEYKFVNDTTWAGAEDEIPWYCSANGNRFINVPESDTILPAVCFESCLVCNPDPVDVTFKVDMSTQIISPDGVHLAGSFKGWDPDTTEMIHEGNDVYAVTLTLGEGEFHEHKFINGIIFDDAEIITGDCANYSGNREFFVSSGTPTLPTDCFGECGPCTTVLYTFNLKVLLEGPFNGTNMNTSLFDGGVIPVDQPFNVEPWLYDGTETLTAPVETELVDWIYIQLRETNGDAASALPDSLIDHMALVVLSDGTVARPDGTPNFYYNGNVTDNLYLLVSHRNHLAVMSATPAIEISETFIFDFTTGLSQAYSFDADGHKLIGGGKYGMIAGDSDASGIIDDNDKDINWKNDAGNAGYYGSDLNMDTQVNNPDKNEIWDLNNGSESQVPQ